MSERLLVKCLAMVFAGLMVLSLPFVLGTGAHLTNQTYTPEAQTSIPVTSANIVFTGNVVNDFASHQVGSNYNMSLWGVNNNISGLYVSYNSTDLFIGVYENVSTNSLFVFLSNNTGSGYGTTNFTNLNAWAKDVNFTNPVNYFAAVYFGSANGGISGQNAFRVNSTIGQSNTNPYAIAIQNTYKFGASNNSTEIAIPWSGLFPNGYSGSLVMNISTFVVGNGGPWVGTGIPYLQEGIYNNGSAQAVFIVNNTIGLDFGTMNIKSSQTGGPINLAIVFNNHQPLYTVVGSSNYQLPWTEAHATVEYIEQPLIAGMYPGINVTYQLSGSLLYQLMNISTDPAYNNSYIQGAFIPWSELNTTANLPLLYNLEQDYFNTPGYIYQLGEPASNLYNTIHSSWTPGTALNQTAFENVKVLWFLYDVSTPLVEGQLGQQWKNSTIWAMHNQTSFTQADLGKILQYSVWLTGQVIPAFRAVMTGNLSGSNNVELMTSPFYHPLVPLVLTSNITGTQGTIAKTSDYSDILAQLNYSKGYFYSLFGQWPTGVWSPEAAVSNETVAAYAAANYNWSQSAESTLQWSGVSALDYGSSANISQMINLYTPYRVMGPNGTSTVMVFRDDTLSNAWGFNYGSMSTSAAVASFINYLKGIYSSLPADAHNNTLVTVALDGENWMYNGFAMDGVPFLEALYAGLEANSSYIHTVTPQQFIATHPNLPVIHNLATSSWNVQSAQAPYQSNTALTQWSGYPVQNFYWEVLNQVRNMVVQYQNTNSLVQLTNYTLIEQNLTASSKQGSLTRAWNAIYAAEGSDWTFTMAPWTISGSNAQPFDYIFKGDLIYALQQLGLAIPDYLTAHPVPAYPATSMGQANQAHSPSLGGYPENSISTPVGIGFSVSANNGWQGTIAYKNNNSVQNAMGINEVDVAYNPSDLYVQVRVNGAASSYIGSQNQRLVLYISPSGINPQSQGNISFDIPGANFQTMYGSSALDFPATYAIELSPYTFNPSGAGQFSVYAASGFGKWNYQISDTNTYAYVGNTIQFEIPLAYLDLIPGNTFYMGAYASALTTVNSNISPMVITIPSALGVFNPISSIHNTVADNGPGNYTYPNQPTQIPPGSLDLQWINVSMNSYDMRWNFTFAQLWNIWNGPIGFSNQIVNVFINENNNSGSKFLGAGPNANSTVPWQYMLYLSGWNAYLQSSSGTQYTSGIVASTNLTARTVSVIVPLSVIGTSVEQYGYIIVAGSYDGYGTNGWRIVDPVNTSNGGWQGGGGNPPWSSNIYTYIAPATLGQGTLTQQQALQYSPHNIPTLAPIYLPKLSTGPSSSTLFNSTSYNGTILFVSNNVYYDLFVSNVSRSNSLYFSQSSDTQKWSLPQSVPSTSGITYFSVITTGSSNYLVYMTTSNGSTAKIAALSLGSSPSLTNIGTISGLSGVVRITSTYNSTSGAFTAISNSTSVQLYKLTLNSTSGQGSKVGTLSGYTNASIATYGGDLYIAAENSTGYLFVIQTSASGSVLKTVSLNISNVASMSESISDYGNLWISYFTHGSSNIYGVNTTLNGQWSFSKAHLLVGGSAVAYAVDIQVVTVGNSSHLILAWGSASTESNTIWAMNTSLSWHNAPPTLVSPAKNNLLIYVIIGVVLGAVVIGVAYYILFRKK